MTATFAILIPARLGSIRLPGKMLASVAGRPLILHTWECARRAPGNPEVYVLTDDDAIEAVVRGAGGEVIRTAARHASGTDRCAEAAGRLPHAAFVNLQGDEPLLDAADLTDLAAAVLPGGSWDMATLGHPFATPRSATEPSAVKVLVSASGEALGFQRRWPPPPWPAGVEKVWHHAGTYAFGRERLLAFPTLTRGRQEERERLEQCRALEAGWRVGVLLARRPAFGVDTPADLEELRRRLQEQARPGPAAPASGVGKTANGRNRPLSP